MPNYSFSNLSGIEFEHFCRDILQKHLGVQLESFGAGPDRGIDLRYSESGGIIIQCKNYKDFHVMMQNLKAETEKVKRLNPSRYLIATSLSLLPDQKEKIIQLFQPYLKGTADIFGRDDLNNLLGLYPEVERSNHKLWLSSAAVLERILHSRTVNDSAFKLEEISEKLRYYVQNDSFEEANAILEKEHYVIISGIPGIGKTTLAEILSYKLSAEQQAEFVNISNSAEEATGLYKEDVFQVFLMDDFLGSTFLDSSFQRNEDKQLLRLIKKVKYSANKRLILTTREYILNQARLKFESLSEFNFAKCVLDLSRYTKESKAMILYNHLYFNDVPWTYLSRIISGGILFTIIEHRNYSPRIIDLVTRNNKWEAYTEADFGTELLNFFDNPLKIWELPFHEHISSFSRSLLYSLLIAGESTTQENLFKQFQCYDSKNSLGAPIDGRQYAFKRSLKELDNSFISTSRTFGNLSINFQNPSIKDFLINQANSSDAIREQLILSASFLQPLVDLFTWHPNLFEPMRMEMPPRLNSLLIKKIMSDFDQIGYNAKSPYQKLSPQREQLLKLTLIRNVFRPKQTERLYSFIGRKFKEIIYIQDLEKSDLDAFTDFLVTYCEQEPAGNLNVAISCILDTVSDIEDFEHLQRVKSHFHFQFEEFIRECDIDLKYEFARIFKRMTINYYDFEQTRQAIQTLLKIEEVFKVDTADVRNRLSEEFNLFASYEPSRESIGDLGINHHLPEAPKFQVKAEKGAHQRILDLFKTLPG